MANIVGSYFIPRVGVRKDKTLNKQEIDKL